MPNKAVMEARRWLEEKKSASNSNSKATEDGAGSPVDMARSYMRARLPCGSPSASNPEFWSPSPAGTQLLKEGTPFPYSAGSLSSSKLKRRSRSNPSRNIQDEIRKVRAKATEEMLKTVSPPDRWNLNKLPMFYQPLNKTRLRKLIKPLKIPNGTGVDNSSDLDNTNAVLALGATLDPSGSFCIPKDVC